MRYEDASQSGSSNNENPVARDDSDALAAGARGPATGNVISGADTQTGSVGADLGADDARIVSISGAQGSDSSFAGGKLAVNGEFGRLSIDAEGNYSYLANKGAPENSRDVFTYKLADAQGNGDSAALTIEIGKSPAVVQANAQQVIPGPDGVVVLPAGVELSDVRVSGRNLVIDLPDGTQMVIVDGAVFVPRLVLGDVEVPATNLAALLIDSEIRPAAGAPQSGGGNFEVPVGPLDPGVDLGDLIPPTELTVSPPEFEEAAFDLDSEPTIVIQTPDQPVGVENAVASVNENALGARGVEPAGSNSASTAETTTGTILFESADSPNVVAIGGVAVNAVGQVIAGTFGSITITSIAAGAIGYSYTLADNTLGDATQELFTVTITDSDGDVDTATLTISIIDDVPAPVADVDSVREDGPLVADGNVLVGSGGSDANSTDGAADTPGADGIALTGIAFGATAGTVGTPLAGAFGSLLLGANGNYTYTLNNQSAAVQALGANEQLTETFTYTVTDGDGDARSTTLTITISGSNDRPTIAASAATVSEEGLAAGNPDSVGTPSDSSNSATATGQLVVADADGDALTVALGAPAGSFTSHGQPISWSVSSDGHVLTGAAAGTTVITVTIGNDGAYSVTLAGPVDHPNANGEDILGLSVPVSVNDGLVSVGSTLTISVEDDSPRISSAAVGSSVLIDETAGASPLSSGAPLVVTSAAPMIAAAVGFGADGPGAATTFGLSLLGNLPVGSSVSTGLQTAVGDQLISLTLTSSTLITATYSAGSQTAFTIQMNVDGTITVTQFTALEHRVDGPSASDHDDSLNLVDGTLDLVNATATYRDFDGDLVSATVPIGVAIAFRDDGPSVTLQVELPTDGQALAALQLTTGDDGTEGNGSTSASTSAAFGGVFRSAADGGADGTASAGIAYQLGLLVAQGADSGLDSNGAAIFLYNVGGTIIGSTSATAPASASDAGVVFTIATSATGVVTLTQYAQVDHSAEGALSGAPFADQLALLGDGLVQLTATASITDNDGDTDSDSSSLDLGDFIRFADDGPAISAALVQGAALRVDETDAVAAAGGEVDPAAGDLGTVTVAAATLFSVTTTSASADAPTTASYALSAVSGTASGLLLSTTDTAIVLVAVSATLVEGRVGTTGGALAFSVSIDAATGAVTLTQYLAVEHPTGGSSHDEDSSGLAAGALGVTITATDFDQDTATASADLGSVIRFEDDGPAIDVAAGSDAAITLATFDSQTIGANDSVAASSADFGGAFAILSSNGGSDGTASVSALGYALGTSGGASGLASNGAAINLYLIGTTVVGSTAASAGAVTAANTIFDVAVDAAGVVTLTQYAQIDHALEAGVNNAPFDDQVASLLDSAITLTATATITDNDGDTASDSASLDIGANLTFADDGPAVTIALNQGVTIRVDETDGVAANGFESDTLADGHLGQAVVSAATLLTTSFTQGADGATASYALSAVSGTASGLLLSTTDTAIVLVAVSATLVEGRVGTTGGALAFSVSIDAATGAVTLTQYLAVEHPTGGSSHDEDSSGLAAGALGVTITATDFDQDSATASADLGAVIRFEDDGPVAIADSATQLVENAPVTIDVFTNDIKGADGAVAASVQLVAGSQIGAGTLTNNGDGTFTLTPVPGQTGTVVFQYSFVDGDGDTAQATATITLLADSAPVAVNVTAKLDDDGLGAGNPSSILGDDNQNLGEIGSGTSSEAVWTGTLGVSAGNADAPISYSLAGMTAAVGTTVGTETVTYAYSSVSGTGTLTATTVGGSRAGTLLFTVTLDEATGAYAVTLNNAIMHPALNGGTGDNSENNSSVVLTYRASDSDAPADFDDATITIDFDDDMPSAFTADSVSFINSGTYDNFAAPASLNLAGKVGADGLGTLTFVDDNPADNYLRTSSGAIITSGGAKIVLSGYGTDTLVGKIENTNTVVVTLEVNPLTNSYAVNFDRPLDDGSGVSLTNLGFATAGNKNFNFIDVAGTTEDLLFSGYNRSASDAVSIGTVNTNNTAIGVNNQSMNDGDNLRIDFVNSPTVSGSASNTYDFPASPGHYAVNNFSFEIVQVGGNTPADGIEIWVRAYDADDVDPTGTSAAHFNELADDPQLAITGIQVNGVSLNLASLASDGNGGYLITGLDLNDRVTVSRTGGYDRLEIENAVSMTAAPNGSLNGDSFDIGKFTFTKINSGTPLEMNFDLALEDADGDRIVVENAITLTSNPVTPVAIDTNHDGSMSYLGLDAGVRYDYDGNGHGEGTAWVGGGDSLLVRDADGNGTVSGASEFVFGGNGLTDLQALHAQYGAQLDANDADFARFMVWNDANSNGAADAGELQSLAEAGIVSIDLVSNGIGSSGAGGDVMVAGESRFTYVNDNGDLATGLVADVAFRTADRESELAQRFAGSANGTGVVTAAIAAMGLAASQAAASPHDVATSGLETAAASGLTAGHLEVASAVAETNDVSRSLLGNETRVAAEDGPTANGTSTSHPAPVVSKLADDGQDSQAPTSLLSPSDAPAHDNAAASAVAPMIVLPSAEAFLAAESAQNGSQGAITVEKVLAEALHGGTGGGDIDALLAALPGQGSGENPALGALASPQGESVSAWDMGPGGHLSAILSANIVADMTVFHHDAVQPAVNG